MTTQGWGRFEAARLALARLEIGDDESLERALAAAARISAGSLHVDRVGVWLFDDDGERLNCIFQFDARTERANVDHLRSFELPSYVRALREHRFVVADDARSHPATRELTDIYLDPLGITSMLDAPVYRGTELIGIVCHEHTGPARQWSVEETHLAATTADVVALLFEQGRRVAAERALRTVEAKQRELALLDDLVRISAGIAHDLNNLLTMVLSTSTLMERKVDDADFVRASSGELRVMAERGARLVQQLMTLRRSLSPPSEPIDLVFLVRQLERVLAAVAVDRILEVRSDLEEAWACADPRAIEQVLANLVTNARQASPPGSRITLSVEELARETPPWLVLSVRDEGRGMEENVQRRAVEPFFTTRPADGGTGLGLDIVATVVRQHGGELRIDSAPDRGTAVRVLLPRADPPA